MKPFRFIHSADWHLDAPFRGISGLPPAVAGRIRDAGFRALDALVDLAIRERVDFLLVSGDLYDVADRSLRAQLKVQQAAGRLAAHGIPLLAVHGNHDPLQGYRARLAMPDNVHIFGGERVETVTVSGRDGEPVAAVSGISYGKAAVTDNLAARFPEPDGSLFAIAMLHTNADGDPAHDNYAPASVAQLAKAGYDYWALGHVHTRKVLCEDPWIVYPGNLQGLSIRETGAKGAYLADVDGDGRVRLSFHPLHAVRWERIAVSIEGMRDEQALMDKLESVLQAEAEREAGIPVVTRLVLEGRGPLHRRLQSRATLDELLDALRETFGSPGGDGRLPDDVFVWVESADVQTGHDLDLDAYRRQESFLGDLVRLSDALLEDETAMRAFLEEAAEPLLANPKAGRRLKAADVEELAGWIAQARELALGILLDEEEQS
jgi:DNA repair exonuclease SbcCD nuclease subunit